MLGFDQLDDAVYGCKRVSYFVRKFTEYIVHNNTTFHVEFIITGAQIQIQLFDKTRPCKVNQRGRERKMKNENCIFCKIAAGEIPSATIYEDEDFRVILDIEPASKGHALILVKEHYANLYELPDELASKVMIVAKKVVTKMSDIVGCDGYNVLQNNGEAAGQTVFHYHMHLIPRFADDNVIVPWKQGTLTEEVKAEILAKIKD